ncbi:hypothetical protein [Metaclostridioides mangenotii]|uniref:hypothetical protein n=1 Tax=Metaclostridioides mangenotii TaxID=1540 RepID=UPI000AADD95E|nr:hypothetical protein [Clostridioides mangenotii]
MADRAEGNSLEAQENSLQENGVSKRIYIYKDIHTGTRSDRPEFNKLLDIL